MMCSLRPRLYKSLCAPQDPPPRSIYGEHMEVSGQVWMCLRQYKRSRAGSTFTTPSSSGEQTQQQRADAAEAASRRSRSGEQTQHQRTDAAAASRRRHTDRRSSREQTQQQRQADADRQTDGLQLNGDKKLQEKQSAMFPLSLLQLSHSPVYVYSQPELPRWTAARLILRQLEDDMLSVSSDTERRMQRLHQAYRLLSNDPDMRRRAAQSGHPATPQDKSSAEGKDGKENFELSLDVSPFSPEDLTVRTEGRRLIVAGKHDKKRETENGGFFQEYREWRREAELPEDVNPEDVLSSMSKDGRLHLWAPRLALPAAKERAVPISTEQSPGEGQGSDPESQDHRGQQEPPQNSS